MTTINSGRPGPSGTTILNAAAGATRLATLPSKAMTTSSVRHSQRNPTHNAYHAYWEKGHITTQLCNSHSLMTPVGTAQALLDT